jgi:hypothetical protein
MQYAWVDKIVIMNYRFPTTDERKDDTEQICKELALPNLELYKGVGYQMHEVLNLGLEKFIGYDFVIVSDSDEFITKASQDEMIFRMSKDDGYDCAQIAMYDYANDFDHIYPIRTHKPPTLCRPGRMKFYEARNLQGRGVIYADIFQHHLGYLFKREDMNWKYNWERPIDKWALEIEGQISLPGNLPQEIRDLIKQNEAVLK